MGDVEMAEIYNDTPSAHKTIIRNMIVQLYLTFISEDLSGSGFKLMVVLSSDTTVIR